jgi:hypothetical protein
MMKKRQRQRTHVKGEIDCEGQISRASRTRKGYADHGYIGMLFEWFDKVSPKRRNLVYLASTGGSHVAGLLRKLERGIRC